MKTLKTLLAVALLTMGTLTASAQETVCSFKPHAYLNLQGGAQYTLTDAKFKDLISPNVQAAIGYQFTPVFGLRLAANGWQSKGAFDTPTDVDYKFNYVAGNIDLMFNLSNLICGWKPQRFLKVTAFVGGGANIAWNNDDAIALNNSQVHHLANIWEGTQKRSTARGGLQFDFRLSDCVGFLIEGSANAVSDYYNSKKSGNADWYFNALAGLRINLGKSYTKKAVAAPQPEPVYVEPVVQPEPPVVEPTPEPVVTVEPLRREVFFLRNKTDIRDTEAQKIADIADYLNKYPQAKVSIVGYADAGTGNDRINDRLARQRADAVVKALIGQYGILADRITYDSKGARVQPFEENDMNRVTICIAE